jgi:hypothetical protein
MSEIVRSHCDMLLPEAQRAGFCARLVDHLATVLSKQSKFDALVARLPELPLEDLLTLSLVANDGVVLFSTHPEGALSARFVPINEEEGDTPREPALDDFERELEALAIDGSHTE